MLVHILVQGETWTVCSPQVAPGFRRCYCAPAQKLTHHQQGQAHTSPLLHSASALQIRRQTGNESCCALVNELITLPHHCQFCFCSPEASTSQGLAVISGWLQGHFMVLHKSKVLKYSTIQLASLYIYPLFNSACDILNFFLSLSNRCQWGTETFFFLLTNEVI